MARPQPAHRTLILGVGNILLGDEGVGVRVIERLAPVLAGVEAVMVLDGGTLGLELLGPIEDSSQLIVVDCMRSGQPGGAVSVLLDEEATGWTTGRDTAHDLGLPSVFALARLRGWEPARAAVVGIEPVRMEPGLELTEEVKRGAAEAAERVLRLVEEWGSLAGA